MKKWSNTIGTRPIRIRIQNQHIVPQPLQTGARPSGPAQREQSYIENILRLNKGEPGIFHFSFEHALESGVNTKAVNGAVEEAGRDHVIIREAATGHQFLFPMIYFDYAEFAGEVKYFPQAP